MWGSRPRSFAKIGASAIMSRFLTSPLPDRTPQMTGIHCRDITSVQQFLQAVGEDTKNWTRNGFAKPWFRGVTDADRHKLLPSILRGNSKQHEFPLTTKFRLMAPGFGPTPPTDRLDQWLFLMQHHRAPTRILDWTEMPLAAAFFATEKAAQEGGAQTDAAVYGIDPIELNKESGFGFFPNTWVQNSVLQTIKFAFGTQDELVEINGQRIRIAYGQYPVAIYPSTVHARISSQRSCFTLHGSDDRDIETIFDGKSLNIAKSLIKYRIPKECVDSMFREINGLGITSATLFPDLDGLARELRYSFGIKG